jgi:hypothetical protein
MSELTERLNALTARATSEAETIERALESVLKEHEQRCVAIANTELATTRSAIEKVIAGTRESIEKQLGGVLLADLKTALEEARLRERSAFALLMRTWGWYAAGTLLAGALLLTMWWSGRRVATNYQEIRGLEQLHTAEAAIYKALETSGVRIATDPRGRVWIELDPKVAPEKGKNGTRWLPLTKR